jgi:acetoin utilization deacetylase AcuC-like enzyme
VTTLLFTHPAARQHINPPGHPESVARIEAIEAALAAPDFATLIRREAPIAADEAIRRAHPGRYLDIIRGVAPKSGFSRLDADTTMSPGSLEAALRGAGAAVAAVDALFDGKADNAFCAMRPPGHHAETARAMGFCIFNSAAIAALHARAEHGIARAAVVDFDVHHGNGTQEIFWDDRDLFYGSTHQMPLYPGTGSRSETGRGNIHNAPLNEGDGGEEFRAAMEETILPALDSFKPELVVISAGFDAHQADPLGGLNLIEADFAWVTQRLMDIAGAHAGDRVVSVLEGGYDIPALARSVAVHVKTLMTGQSDG